MTAADETAPLPAFSERWPAAGQPPRESLRMLRLSFMAGAGGCLGVLAVTAAAGAVTWLLLLTAGW